MIEAAVFLLSLPLAVYTLAGLFLFIDHATPFQSLLRLTWRILLVALLAFVTPANDRLWIGAAFLTVILLDTLALLASRYILGSSRWIADRIE